MTDFKEQLTEEINKRIEESKHQLTKDVNKRIIQSLVDIKGRGIEITHRHIIGYLATQLVLAERQISAANATLDEIASDADLKVL